ncbi:MAG: hypothetical protein HRT64_11125, partial [Erythrobacter sp.]|nr:hypothetical protein [Erythrobacter sp.]
MGCHFETGYTLASGERDWRHARMLLPGVSGTVAASTTAAGYYDDAPDGQETYTRWKPSAVPATWDITPAGSVSCNAAFIGAHDLGTQGATVTVQYQATDGGAWTDIMSVTPGDDAPLFLFFTAKDGFGWRVSLTGAVAEIGRIIFGTTIVMPQPIYGGVKPIDLTREVERKASVSQGGEILGLSVRNVMLG